MKNREKIPDVKLNEFNRISTEIAHFIATNHEFPCEVYHSLIAAICAVSIGVEQKYSNLIYTIKRSYDGISDALENQKKQEIEDGIREIKTAL
jgi:hypothetical protein